MAPAAKARVAATVSALVLLLACSARAAPARATPLIPSLVTQNISYPDGKWNNYGKPYEGLNEQVRGAGGRVERRTAVRGFFNLGLSRPSPGQWACRRRRGRPVAARGGGRGE